VASVLKLSDQYEDYLKIITPAILEYLNRIDTLSPLMNFLFRIFVLRVIGLPKEICNQISANYQQVEREVLEKCLFPRTN
jgi:hypothetical protein